MVRLHLRVVTPGDVHFGTVYLTHDWIKAVRNAIVHAFHLQRQLGTQQRLAHVSIFDASVYYAEADTLAPKHIDEALEQDSHYLETVNYRDVSWTYEETDGDVLCASPMGEGGSFWFRAYSKHDDEGHEFETAAFSSLDLDAWELHLNRFTR